MTDKRCAYLTMADTEGWSIDADLGFLAMEALGWHIDAIPWRAEAVDWDRFMAVYIGVPWDYPEDPQHFMSVLETIDRSNAILVNDLSLVRWAMPKTYLRDLECRGAAIVPSLWCDEMDIDLLRDAFDTLGTERIIVKPVISTNATDTYLLTPGRVQQIAAELMATFGHRPFVVQPFIDNIQTEGEFSLFYFNRLFSHAIKKIPADDDFRVQEEHGARIVAAVPERLLVETGDQVIRLVDPLPAYARADFVRGSDGRFLIMELELIEPSMYLRMDPQAPQRFAAAFDDYVRQVAAGNENGP